MFRLARSEETGPPPKGGTGRGGWLFLACLGAGQICSWGALYYAFPQIAEQIERDMGWSRAALYGAASAGLALSALVVFPVGRAIDAGRGRIIMAGGSVLAGLLCLAWSAITDLLGLYAVVGLLGAVQAAVLYEAAFAVAARRYGAGEARNAIATLTLFGGFASTVFIPLVEVLVDVWGWRGALLVLGAINFATALLYWIGIDPSRDHVEPARPAGSPPQADISAVMRSPVFWGLALAFTAHAGTFTAFTFHMYPMFLELGASPEGVILALALIGPAQVAGRVVMMTLASRRPVAVIGAVVVAVFPVAFTALKLLPATTLLICCVAIAYGAANGVLTIVRGASVPELLSRTSYGAVMGAMSIPSTIARALAPLGAAMLWSADRSYQPVLTGIVAGAIVLAASFWLAALLARRRPGVGQAG